MAEPIKTYPNDVERMTIAVLQGKATVVDLCRVLAVSAKDVADRAIARARRGRHG